MCTHYESRHVRVNFQEKSLFYTNESSNWKIKNFSLAGKALAEVWSDTDIDGYVTVAE